MTAIIDAHYHIWRRRDLPWLDGPMQPRIFGAYESIQRDYPIGEYLVDIAGCEVTRSVYVQANWAKAAFEDEVVLPGVEADYSVSMSSTSGFTNDALFTCAIVGSPAGVSCSFDQPDLLAGGATTLRRSLRRRLVRISRLIGFLLPAKTAQTSQSACQSSA